MLKKYILSVFGHIGVKYEFKKWSEATLWKPPE
jgi:hypothetical protein